MAKKKSLNKKVENQVLKYLDFIKKKGFKLDKAIVFGSHTKGAPKKWSDIDLCLISKRFKGDDFEDSVKLSTFAYDLGFFIEPHLFDPQEFQNKYDPLAEEIRKYGIEVKYPS